MPIRLLASPSQQSLRPNRLVVSLLLLNSWRQPLPAVVDVVVEAGAVVAVLVADAVVMPELERARRRMLEERLHCRQRKRVLLEPLQVANAVIVEAVVVKETTVRPAIEMVAVEMVAATQQPLTQPQRTMPLLMMVAMTTPVQLLAPSVVVAAD